MNPDIKNGKPPRERNLAFLDIETTGLNLDHEIIEIGVLRASQPDFKIIEEFDLKIKPHHLEMADPDALSLVGYNETEWQDAIELKGALEILETKCRGDILIGENFTFDWARLEKAFFENGHPAPAFYYHRMDVKSMIYYKFYNDSHVRDFTLSEVCRYLGIERGRLHRGLDDARAIYEVFKKIMANQNG